MRACINGCMSSAFMRVCKCVCVWDAKTKQTKPDKTNKSKQEDKTNKHKKTKQTKEDKTNKEKKTKLTRQIKQNKQGHASHVTSKYSPMSSPCRGGTG